MSHGHRLAGLSADGALFAHARLTIPLRITGRAKTPRGTAWFVFLLPCLLLSSCSPASPPRLLVPEGPVDLGEAIPGEALRGSIPLRNAGGRELQLQSLQAGCDCAWLGLPRRTILPGEELNLEVGVRLKSEGQDLQFPVRIRSNDPGSPETTCLVRARAVPPILRTDPEQLHFGEVARGSTPSRRLQLLAPDGQPWPGDRPSALDVARGLVQVCTEHEPGTAGASSLVLVVQASPDLPAGGFQDTVTIRPAESHRRIQVAVTGAVVPRLIVTPTTVYFGDVSPSAGTMTRRLLVRRTDGQPLPRLAKVDCPAGLKVEAQDQAIQPSSPVVGQLRVTLQSAEVTGERHDGELLLWWEGEPEPLRVGVLVVLARKDVGAQP